MRVFLRCSLKYWGQNDCRVIIWFVVLTDPGHPELSCVFRYAKGTRNESFPLMLPGLSCHLLFPFSFSFFICIYKDSATAETNLHYAHIQPWNHPRFCSHYSQNLPPTNPPSEPVPGLFQPLKLLEKLFGHLITERAYCKWMLYEYHFSANINCTLTYSMDDYPSMVQKGSVWTNFSWRAQYEKSYRSLL